MKYSIISASVLFYLLLPLSTWAQTPPPPPGGAPPGFALPSVLLLSLAGLGLGMYSYFKKPKK